MEDKKYTRQELTKLNKELKPQGKKCCSKCEEVNPISEFGNLRGNVGGMSWCIVCNKKRGVKFHKDNPDVSKTYYQKNKERIVKRVCDYNKTSDKRKSYMKQYLKDNKEVLNKKQAIRRKERYHNDAEYYFREKIRGHLRGVQKRKEFTDIWESTYKMYDDMGIEYHIDHMIPKNWFKMNTPKSLINHLDNLQVIDSDYNTSKQDRWSDPVPSEYLNKIRPYIKEERLGDLKSV